VRRVLRFMLLRTNIPERRGGQVIYYYALLRTVAAVITVMSVNCDFSAALGKVIRKHRERQGMSLARLAENSGLSQTYPGKFEKELVSPTVDAAYAMSKALKVPFWKVVKEAESAI